ncbi:YiiD C-terminal domain-containing protein [Labrys okinawensis]|uniref:YiiD C-terminal domain-containing protein n=1 Tax=Labrys okinawensis TaxID=346911 RepID=UPI0039BC3573
MSALPVTQDPLLLPAELEADLHANIPLTRAMQVRVLDIADDSVCLGAPLAPNINHHGTVFGGSLATLATLAAWSLAHLKLRRAGIDCSLVVGAIHMDYLAPAEGDVLARSRLAEPDNWPHVLEIFARKGKARIPVLAEVDHDGRCVARFKGDFAALAR